MAVAAVARSCRVRLLPFLSNSSITLYPFKIQFRTGLICDERGDPASASGYLRRIGFEQFGDVLTGWCCCNDTLSLSISNTGIGTVEDSPDLVSLLAKDAFN